MKRIIFILKDGKMTIQTEGYEGASCQEATKFLEDKLGKPSGDSPTGEMYQENVDLEAKQ